MSNVNEIDEIKGREVELEVRGHKIIVREVVMRDLKEFAAACAPFFAAFDEAGELGNPDRKPEDFALFKVLANNSDAFMKAASLVTNANFEFYQKLKPDEFFKVAAAVVEVNGSFFIQALAPALIKFAQGVSQVGLILSSASSQQATGEMSSSTTH